MTTKELRNARRAFRKQYGSDRFRIVELLVSGLSSTQVAGKLDVSVGTVAAVKANLTRGTYDPYVSVNDDGVGGTCFRK